MINATIPSRTQSGDQYRSICLSAMAGLMMLAATAEANWVEYCPAIQIRGPVATMTVWEHALDRKTGESIGEHKATEVFVSPDKRKVTVIRYEADTAEQAKLKLYPTYSLEYDEKGRLVTEALNLYGKEDYTVTRCDYDSASRISLVTQRSQNLEQGNKRITYTYGNAWRSQRTETKKAVVLVTQLLDQRGRPVKETRVHETFQEKSERTFEHIGDVTRICYFAPGGEKYCTNYRYDADGNEIDARSERGFRQVTYEYDSRGNWILERVESAASGVQPYRRTELRRREITYRGDR